MMTRYSKPEYALAAWACAHSFATWFASVPAISSQSISAAPKPRFRGFRIAQRGPLSVSIRCRLFQRVITAFWNRCRLFISREGVQMMQSRLTQSPEKRSSQVDCARRTGISANSQFALRSYRTLDRCVAKLIDRQVSLRRLTDSSAPDSRKNHNHVRTVVSAQSGPAGRQQRMNHYEENNVNQRVAIRRKPDRDCRRQSARRAVCRTSQPGQLRWQRLQRKNCQS